MVCSSGLGRHFHIDGLQGFRWNLVNLYVASPRAVIMHDPLYCRMLVLSLDTTACLVMSCTTHIVNGNKLLVACVCFLVVCLTASDYGLLIVAHPTCILPACDIGRSDLARLAHSSSIGDFKQLLNGVFLYKNITDFGFSPVSLGLDKKTFRSCVCFC